MTLPRTLATLHAAMLAACTGLISDPSGAEGPGGGDGEGGGAAPAGSRPPGATSDPLTHPAGLGGRASEEPAVVHAAAERGDFRSVNGLLSQLEAEPGEEALGWAFALRAVGALADPKVFRAPGLDEIDRLRDARPAARAAACLACGWCEKAAIVRFDEAGLAAWADVHRALVDGLGEVPQAAFQSARG